MRLPENTPVSQTQANPPQANPQAKEVPKSTSPSKQDPENHIPNTPLEKLIPKQKSIKSPSKDRKSYVPKHWRGVGLFQQEDASRIKNNILVLHLMQEEKHRNIKTYKFVGRHFHHPYSATLNSLERQKLKD